MDASNMTGALISWLTSTNWERILLALIVFAAGVLVGYLLRILVYRGSIKVTPVYISRALSRAVYYVVIVLAVISALQIMGVDLTGFIIAGGILGIILGFALQSIVANLVSGLLLYWERPFKPGDLVEMDDAVGVVSDITIMSTRIIGLDGVVIRVPNDKIFTSTIRNITAKPAKRIEFTIGIAYGEDAEKAYEVLRQVVEDHPLVLVEPKPDIFVEELADSSVNIKVRVWVPSREGIRVKRELLWRLKKAITNAGIEIPFPQRDLWFRSPIRVVLEGGDKTSG